MTMTTTIHKMALPTSFTVTKFVFLASLLLSLGVESKDRVVSEAFVLPPGNNNHHTNRLCGASAQSQRQVSALFSSSPSNNDSSNTTINDNRGGRVDKGFNLLEIASSIVPQGQIVRTAKESWKFLWLRFMTELAPQDSEGNYVRPAYTAGGEGQTVSTLGCIQHPIEGNRRYTVYLGNPCPWCHRVKLVVNLLGLETSGLVEVVTLIDDPVRASRGGWVMPSSSSSVSSSTTTSKTKQNTPSNIRDLRELYEYLKPGFKGRCTAPLLVDWKSRSIVSNESKDIVRMLPLLLDCLSPTAEETDKTKTKTKSNGSTTYNIDLYPSHLQSSIDEQNGWIYEKLSNGVYRCGFGTTQKAINKASQDVLEGLERCEMILSKQAFMCSDDTLTESDVMLLPTMLRYDGVYSPLFKAGGTHIRLECDYPSIFAWLQRCWNDVPGVSQSIDLTDACHSYYKQLFPLNPSGILPTPITAKSLRLEK